MLSLHFTIQLILVAGSYFLVYNMLFALTLGRCALWALGCFCALFLLQMVSIWLMIAAFFLFTLMVSLLYLRIPVQDRLLSFFLMECTQAFINQVLLLVVCLVNGDQMAERLWCPIYLLESDFLYLVALSAVIRILRKNKVTIVPERRVMFSVGFVSLVFTGQIIFMEWKMPPGAVHTNWFMTFSSILGGILCISLAVENALRCNATDSNQELQKHVDTLGLYLRERTELEKGFRRFRHDIRHHAQVIDNLAKTGDTVRLQEYMKQFTSAIPSAEAEYARSGNRVMDALLYESSLKAKAAGVQMDVAGTICDPFLIPDYDLCAIVSNLVENAIEYEVGHDMHRVAVRMFTDTGSAVIEVRNQVEDDLDPEQVIRKTSKENEKNHGFGVSNVCRIVAKHQGQITFTREGDEFVAQVTLYPVAQ